MDSQGTMGWQVFRHRQATSSVLLTPVLQYYLFSRLQEKSMV